MQTQEIAWMILYTAMFVAVVGMILMPILVRDKK